MIINQGFLGRRNTDNKRLPPGQFETRDFPVLSLGPTPHVNTSDWQLKIWGLVDNETTLSWEGLTQLAAQEIHTDIHCVTRWSKFDTDWTGIPFEQIVALAQPHADVTHVIAHSYDGYTTNIPLADLQNGQAFIATAYDGDSIAAEHGGPARLFIPHLYFWKSAKWLNGIEFLDHDEPGFWEVRGYHNYGDPWKEQRYTDDE